VKPRRHYSIRHLLALCAVLGALILAVSLVPLAALDWERVRAAHEHEVIPGYQYARALIQERVLAAHLLAQQAAGVAQPLQVPSSEATILILASDGSWRSSSGRSLPRLTALAPSLPADTLAGIEVDDQGNLVAVGACPGHGAHTIAFLPFTTADAQAIKEATGLDSSFVVDATRTATTLYSRQGQPATGLAMPREQWQALLAEPGRLRWSAEPALAQPSLEEVALPLSGVDGLLVGAYVAARPSADLWTTLLYWGWPWLGAMLADLAIILALTAWLRRRLLQPFQEARRGILALANRRDAAALAGECGLSELDEVIVAVNQLSIDRAALVLENRQLNERLVQTQTLTTVGQVAVGVAHDLNNPLATIIAVLDIIPPGSVDPELQHDLDVIRRQAERSGRLVSSLLGFARQQSELQWVSINTLISQTLDLLAYQARVNSIHCELHLNQDLPLTWADPSPLQQALFNLINNALQAMAGGRGRGTLRVQSSWSPPEPGAPYGRIAVHVQDDGPGIPDDVWPHLFKPFFTTKGPRGGTGLGLATAGEIVQRHGGRIWAENNAGGGASFFVELPVASEPSPEPASDGEQRRHVLLADSNPQRISALAQALRRRGYVLSTAGDGLSARHKIELEPLDLVLCAFELARLDGRELYAWARTRHPSLARRFVFVAPANADGEVDAFLQATRLAALRHPWPDDALEALLNQALLF